MLCNYLEYDDVFRLIKVSDYGSYCKQFSLTSDCDDHYFANDCFPGIESIPCIAVEFTC